MLSNPKLIQCKWAVSRRLIYFNLLAASCSVTEGRGCMSWKARVCLRVGGGRSEAYSFQASSVNATAEWGTLHISTRPPVGIGSTRLCHAKTTSMFQTISNHALQSKLSAAMLLHGGDRWHITTIHHCKWLLTVDLPSAYRIKPFQNNLPSWRSSFDFAGINRVPRMQHLSLVPSRRNF